NSAKKEKSESESKGEVLHITVYRDTVEPELHGDDNLTELEVSKPLFMEYFRERILPSFKGDDDTVSEEGMLQEWLDEYTADDTTDLYDFIQLEEKKVKDKEYYQKLYDKKFDELLEKAKNEGLPDPEAWANDTFDDSATAEEVVGYYIVWHGDDAFKDWVENSQFYERERGKIPSEQDRAVTRILGELYDNTVVKGIEWYIPEGTLVNPKLSEVKVIPKVTGRTEEECTEAVRLYLQLTYATEPKAFSFMLPDGKMAGYRNWELSSTTKKDDGVGCYGVGSALCLNGCAGCDSDPVDWIVGISGSDMDDVIVKVITGTTDAVKRHLLMEVQNIRADGEDDWWDSGTEKVEDIKVRDDGKLYACACFSDCHFDLTATPMSNVQHIMPFH
ncbi:MAG: hypothetical protein IJJ65_09005, partial [Butyrivibrio sp.]|nr:hypothetical protein [Butyrivibrio sp.]